MEYKVKTPAINVDKDKILPLTKNDEIMIIALPDTDNESIQKVHDALRGLSLSTNIVIIQGRAACITKDDILNWHKRIELIIEGNGWKK